jgi:hypothetical protein
MSLLVLASLDLVSEHSVEKLSQGELVAGGLLRAQVGSLQDP